MRACSTVFSKKSEKEETGIKESLAVAMAIDYWDFCKRRYTCRKTK
jgi:hypothetical protein